VIYNTLPTVADIPGRTRRAPSNRHPVYWLRPDGPLLQCPSGGYIGLTNSKVNDAQAGYETGMSVTAGYLGGVDIFNMAGLLDALMAFDFAKARDRNEIALMLKRISGFEFSAENFALDQIARSAQAACSPAPSTPWSACAPPCC
jgi:hypothetical protein